MMHTREAPPLRGKAAIRRFGYLAALSAPWLALLGFLAWSSRRFVLDDAFISFRYARNLLEGHGLVWNPGERVEGYSNFLWVLELAAIWAATGVPPEDSVWWLSAAVTVATLAAMAWWAWRLPGLRNRGLVWWMALGLVCGSATFAMWTGGGLETRQFTFFVVLAVVALTAHRGSRRGLLVASFSLALASLTRPEGPLIAACCFAWWAAQELADGERSGGGREWALGTLNRIDWRGALALALPFLLIVGAHFLWRYSYYDEWLPNTYYAKYVRPWWDIGLQYLAAAGLETGLYLLLPLGAGAALGRWRERRDLAYGLPLLIIALYAVYLARNGGHNHGWRALDFYWPLLALPAADGLARVGGAAAGAWDRLRARLRRGEGAYALDGGERSRNGRLWAVALFLPALIYAGAIQGALFWDTFHRWGALSRTTDNNPAVEWRPAWVPPVPGMPALVALSGKLRDTTMSRGSGRRLGPGFHNYSRTVEAYGDMERGLIPDDAVAVVRWAGVAPYYLPDLTFVDYHGLNDWVIARNPVARPNSERILAHDRFPPPGYLEERGVNFRVRAPAPNAGGALSRGDYALQFAPGLWMPFEAPSLEWVEARFDSFVTAEDLRAFASDHGRLAANSEFDVYAAPASDSLISGGRRTLAYVREPCAEEDISARFFLHLNPSDRNDLPEERREFGFDNLNFYFAHWGSRRDGRCIAVHPLPDYPIASVATGQFTGDGEVWIAKFALPDAGRE